MAMGNKNISIPCPICHSKDFIPFIESNDFFLTKDLFKISECKNCGLKLTNPRPHEDNLKNYYNSPEYISHTNTRKGFINFLYYQIRRITLRFKIRLIQRYKLSGSVLDIGCGTGEFLKEIGKKNFIVTGIEPNANARDYARNQNKLFVIDEHEINRISDVKFDIITMWHVLEHVADLNLRISQVNSLIRDDGILIIAVPNSDSWDSRIYEKFWAAYDLPRHLYHFNQKSMQNLLFKGGFTLVQIIPLIFDSFYISLLSEKYKTGKSNFFKATLNGFISNLWGMTHNNNYSSLIYIYKINKT